MKQIKNLDIEKIEEETYSKKKIIRRLKTNKNDSRTNKTKKFNKHLHREI